MPIIVRLTQALETNLTADLLTRTLEQMDRTVHELSKLVPQPKQLPFKDGFVFRHTEQTQEQAIVQKLSRIPSGLGGALTLLNAGFFQEQATLQRVLDEITEDVLFLSSPLIGGVFTDLHREYLDSFFAEEFDFVTGGATAQDRPMVRRKKIRAYIANTNSTSSDPSGHIEAARSLSKTYSGFVHAASPHIMDMYGGDPPKFHTSGMLGTVRESEYRRDIYNYFYRGNSAFVIGSRALQSRPQFDLMFALNLEYEALMGIT